MELVINSKSLEELPEREIEIVKPSGFLNSRYKSVVKNSLNHDTTKSIFGIRRRIKSRRQNVISSAEVMLKVSAFFAIILVIFS